MTVYKTQAIQLSPEELADLFTEMNNEEQAKFFAEITRQTGDWPGAGWCAQSHDIVMASGKEARDAIRTLASHLPQEDIDWIVGANGDS